MAQPNTPYPAPAIAIAQGGPIASDTLNQILPAARAAAFDPDSLTPELGAFMLVAFAAMAEELIQRRRQLELIFDASNPDNVVQLFRPGDN